MPTTKDSNNTEKNSKSDTTSDPKKTETVSYAAGLTNTTNGYGFVKNAQQTRNTGVTVTVPGEVIDDTEGYAAMDTLPFEPNTRNFDIGGGQFDSTSQHVHYFYKVKNYVYDPFNRSQKHNNAVLAEISSNPVDTVTSISVLNVILDEEQRKQHIKLAYQSLREGGMAFFKVYRGTGSNVPDASQSNTSAVHYISEIQAVFGNAYIPQDDIGNTIFAKKKTK